MDAPAYLDQLQQLLPNGPAWPRDRDADLTRLLDAFAQEFGRLDARTARLIEEADPRTTLELLSDWERVAGLPDACTGQISVTIPERRAAIVSKITARGGQSPAYLTALAASLGYQVAIEEFRPMRAGCRAGDRCHSVDWAFAFRVDVLPPRDVPGGEFTTASVSDTRFRAGAGRAGDRLRSFGSTALECVIGRAKPAHTVAIFAYPDAIEAAFLYDFTTH
ncbi:DUF2313 domain-containing protein [soil metagenome]